MRTLKCLSALGLILTVAPAFLVFADLIEWQTHAQLMILGTILWFSSATFWMKTK